MVNMKVRTWAGAAAVALILAGSGAFGLQAATNDQASGLWFVEFDGPVDSLRAQARAAGADYSERFVYRRLWKGLSVRSTSDGAAALKKLQGVRAVYPVVTIPMAPRQSASPELIHALTMTGADVAQSEIGLTGRGVKVAVMDTGIDYHHPDLGGGFGPGFRVVTGFDFVGDRFNAIGSGGALVPHPDNNPDDCNGHGTHVAGIIGASGDPATGGARGVAPEVTFGAYRVFGCTGSTTADIMLAAMERAQADGMDVLNMSIGAAFQTWPQYPTAVAADALVAAGMVVVTSIGNAGAFGVYSASAPGVGRNVIGVGSIENSHVTVATFILNPGERVVGYTTLGGTATAAGPPPPPTTGTTPEIVYVGRGCIDGNLTETGNQTDPYLGNPAGKVALITRGVCSFDEKYRRAADAGAAGVIVENNAPGIFFGGFVVSRGIFGIGISQADGTAVRGLVAPTATWSDDSIDVPNPTGGLTSSFSSYGLNAELQLKPNIAAPGGLIRSTVPLEQGGYDTISGTSMASPHVAGAAALFLQAHPNATPAAIKAALQNSADPVLWSGNPGLGFNEPVHRQGAGMVDIDDAIAATTAIDPSELSLGEDLRPAGALRPHERRLTITNNGDQPVTYTFVNVPAIGTGNTFVPSFLGNFATLVPDGASLTVPAGGSATFDVAITPNPAAAAARTVYGGHIRVTGSDGQRYSVPYAGMAGDYQSIQVLAPGGCVFPGIFRRGGETVCPALSGTIPASPLDIAVTRQAENATFNVEDKNDRPVILFHLAHQSRHIEIRAVDAVTGESHLVAFDDYLPRNATNGRSLQDDGFVTFTWDGKGLFTNGAGKMKSRGLPAGPYKLQIVVTKALAEANNPAHVETYTSPTIIITRK
jgi:subtilisin family serine protease